MISKLVGTATLTVRAVAVALIAVAGVGVIAAPAVGAQDPCDTIVSDDTGRLGDAGEAQVAEAAGRLTDAHGATVRVRVTDTLPDGEPSAYLAEQLRRCASWSDGESGRDPRLLTIIVGLDDRATGLYYGGAFSALDAVEADIQADSMNPRFAEGDFAAGIVAGLDAAADRLADPDGSAATGGSSSGPSAGAVAAVFAILALLCALGAGIWFAVDAIRSRRERARQLESLRARRTALGETSYQLSETVENLDHELLVAATHPDDIAALAELRATLRDTQHDVASSIAAIDVTSSSDLDVVSTALDAAGSGVKDLERRIAAARTTISELETFADTFDDAHAAAVEALDDAEAAVVAAAAAGFDVSGHRVQLTGASAQLDTATLKFADGCRTGARSALDAAAAATAEAQSAANLEGSHTDTVAAHERNAARIDELTAALAAADSALAALRGTWADSALERFRAASSGAATTLRRAQGQQARVDLDRFAFSEDARSAVATIAADLDDVRRSVAEVAGAEEELRRAAAEAERVAADADALRRRVDAHRYRRSYDSTGFDRYRSATGGHADPFAAQIAAVAALTAAQSAWSSAESARRSAESSASSYGGGSSSSYGGGSSTSFGGGGSSSSFGGGGSSSNW